MKPTPPSTGRPQDPRRRTRDGRTAWAWRLAWSGALITASVVLCPQAWGGLGSAAEPWLGAVALLAAGYVAYRKRARMQAWTIRRAWVGPALLLAAAGCCATDHAAAMAARLPLILAGCLLSVYGTELARRFPTAWLPLACASVPGVWATAVDRATGAALDAPLAGFLRWMHMSATAQTGALGLAATPGREALTLDPIVWTLTLVVGLTGVALGQRRPRRQIAWTLTLVPVGVVLANACRVAGEAGAWTLWMGDARTLGPPAMLLATVATAWFMQRRSDPMWADLRRARLWRQCANHTSAWDRWSPAAAASILLALGLLS